MKIVRFIIVVLLICLSLQLLFLSTFWEKLEHSLSDTFFLTRGERAISGDIVIVEIGDNTFSALNQQWPFPREYYARVINNLQKAGARQIVFDIEFTENSDPASDAELAAVAAQYDNIIFAGKVIRQQQDIYSKEQILPPIRELQEAGVLWGTVNISLDNDGFVRRYELLQTVQKTMFRYAIGVLSVAAWHQDPEWEASIHNGNRYFKVREKYIPKVTSRSCLLNYYGPDRTFRYYDFSDVLDDESFELPLNYDLNSFEMLLEDNAFRHKTVIIGPTADEFHDSHNTPFSTHNRKLMPGVEIHANFMEMVMNDDFLELFPKFTYLLIFFGLAVLLLLLNYRIKPTRSLLINLVLIVAWIFLAYLLFTRRNQMIPILEVPLLIIIIYITGLLGQYIRTLKERKFIKQAFDQYLSPELVNVLLKDPGKLEYGGEQKEISVLFADIRDFTAYTESHSPRETVSILQEYLTAMVEVIRQNKGTLDKFVGDAVIAIFGAPVALDNHAFWACKAALEMRLKFNQLLEKWQAAKKDTFEIGIGINSGIATVGNLGSKQIFDYTAIGDTMNTGARIESLNKEYKTRNKIIISEITGQMAGEQIITEFLAEIRLRGKAGLTKVYELNGIKTEI